MHAGQHFSVIAPSAFDKRHVHSAAGHVFVGVGGELAVCGVHVARADFVHQRFSAAAVGNQVCDGANLQAVFSGEDLQIRQTCHRAIVFHDFTNHGRG